MENTEVKRGTGYLEKGVIHGAGNGEALAPSPCCVLGK